MGGAQKKSIPSRSQAQAQALQKSSIPSLHSAVTFQNFFKIDQKSSLQNCSKAQWSFLGLHFAKKINEKDFLYKEKIVKKGSWTWAKIGKIHILQFFTT